MSDLPVAISGLDASDPLDGTEQVEVNQGGTSARTTTQAIVNLAGTTTVVAASGAAEELTMAPAGSDAVYDVTMDEDCTFSFAGAVSGTAYSVTLILSGAFTPTFPAAVVWADGTAPTYGAPSVYEFLTTDGGTTVYGFLAGGSFA